MGEQKNSPDVMKGIIQVFSNVYAFLDPGATLFFVTYFIARKFYVIPDVLIEPFLFLPECVTL